MRLERGINISMNKCPKCGSEMQDFELTSLPPSLPPIYIYKNVVNVVTKKEVKVHL